MILGERCLGVGSDEKSSRLLLTVATRWLYNIETPSADFQS